FEGRRVRAVLRVPRRDVDPPVRRAARAEGDPDASPGADALGAVRDRVAVPGPAAPGRGERSAVVAIAVFVHGELPGVLRPDGDRGDARGRRRPGEFAVLGGGREAFL